MEELYIALIEDDEDDIHLLKDCFKKYNSIEIRSFLSSQEFLNANLNGSLPCLLVIDLNLPDIRGIDLFEHIKATPSFVDVPIIIYTTSYSRTEKIRCDDLNIRLLKKPDTVVEWDNIASMMAHHCDASL